MFCYLKVLSINPTIFLLCHFSSFFQVGWNTKDRNQFPWDHDIFFHLQEKCGVSGTLSLNDKDTYDIYDVLQHYYSEQGSPESWSSLLMSLLVDSGWKQQRSTCTQPIHKYNPSTINAYFLKDVKLAECLVACTHVPTLKHEVKQHIYNPETAFSTASLNKQTAVSGYIRA